MSRAAIESVFGLLDREVWLLTARAGTVRAGLAVTLVGQASIVPDHPRIWVGLSPQHFTTTVVRQSLGFRLHLVDQDHFDLIWTFGTQSGHDVDKFAGRHWEESPWARPKLADAVAWLECSVESYIETGDRMFFLARVLDGAECTDRPPLTLHGLRRMLSPAQTQEMNARLVRDAAVDADLIRRWQAGGYQPVAIRTS
jgi:flavin reductase (DIM6/NTAB) family NADH-FMN oxidoreductase RutF